MTMQPQENPYGVLLELHGDCTVWFFLKNLYCLERNMDMFYFST